MQSIGEKEAKRLAEHYRVDLKIPSDYQEKSASFVDVFNPDYDSSSFRKDFGKDILGHESIETTQNYIKISTELKRKVIENVYPIKKNKDIPIWKRDENILKELLNI